MKVRLFGTRGSISVSGSEYLRYGGMTTCIEITTNQGDVIILDAGTGIRKLGQQLKDKPATICLTHLHFDHLIGIAFFPSFYDLKKTLTIYATRFKEHISVKDAFNNIFNGVIFPVSSEQLPNHDIHEIHPGDSFMVGSAKIETIAVNHSHGSSLAYRITADGWTFAFSGDHEIVYSSTPEHPDPISQKLFDFLAKADVALVDAHFTQKDHELNQGWGHSHFEQWPEALSKRGLKHLIYTHYNPNYTDDFLDDYFEILQRQFVHLPINLYMGKEGSIIDKNGIVNDHLIVSDCDVCDFFQRVAGFSDTHSVLTAILTEARRLTYADAGTIYLVEDDELAFSAAHNDTLFPKSASNKFVYLNARLPINDSSIVGYVADTGEHLRIDDVYDLPKDVPYSFNQSFDKSTGYRTQSMLVLPLINNRNTIIGVLQLINCKINDKVVPFSSRLQHLIARFSVMATIPIERSLMVGNMIMRMLKTSALKDPNETAGHVQRVGSIAAELYHHWAERQGYDLEDILAMKGQLRLAAMLHDVGKVGIPDAVLKKPGRLDDEERKVMQTHAALGASLFKGSNYEIDQLAWEISMFHHAKWDGTGYTGSIDVKPPSGEDIPLCARIVAIADVYDALVSKRCYKAAWDPSQALGILQKDAGSHFDPNLVQDFLEIQDLIKAIFDRYEDTTYN